jgi:tetratricopeptide (TPR) repeat protein
MTTWILRWTFACLVGTGAIASAANADMGSTDRGPDLSAVRAAINAKNYPAALAQLKVIEATSPTPDVDSLMGFALRKIGDRAQAMTYYTKALAADPANRGALEYQGELYVEIGQIDKAKENLAKLHKACWPFGCEEHKDLEEDIKLASKAK